MKLLPYLLIFLYEINIAHSADDVMKLVYHTCDPKDQERLDALRFLDLNSVYITKFGQFERFYPVKAKKGDTNKKRYIVLCNDDNQHSANKLRVCYSDGATSSAEFEVDLWNVSAGGKFKVLSTARFNHESTHVFHICIPGGWGTILVVDCSYQETVASVKAAEEDDDFEDKDETQNPNRRLIYFHIGFGCTIILNATIVMVMSCLIKNKKKVEKDKSSQSTPPSKSMSAEKKV